MINGRFALSAHILTVLAFSEEGPVSSAAIASSINVNPVLVRKELSSLREAGLVETREGKNGGSVLARAAKKISMADIYKATYQEPIFSHSKNTPNLNCPVGRLIGKRLDVLNTDAEKALLKKLQSISLEQFCKPL